MTWGTFLCFFEHHPIRIGVRHTRLLCSNTDCQLGCNDMLHVILFVCSITRLVSCARNRTTRVRGQLSCLFARESLDVSPILKWFFRLLSMLCAWASSENDLTYDLSRFEKIRHTQWRTGATREYYLARSSRFRPP